MRSRIVELRRVPASDLHPDPRNFRRHGEAQRVAMRRMLDRVGWVDGVIAREDSCGRLIIVNGHLRAGISPDDEVPVLVTDLSEAEAGEVLATFDPLGSLADVDAPALDQLLAGIEADADLGALLAGMHGNASLEVPDAPTPAPPPTAPPGQFIPSAASEETFPWTLQIPREDYFRVQDLAERLGRHWRIAGGSPAGATVQMALELAERLEFGDPTPKAEAG